MNAQEYLKRGIEYYNKEDDNRAFADFIEALRLDPNLAEAKKYLASFYFNFGVVSYQKGDKEQAITNFTKATDLDKTEAQYFGALASAYSEKKDYDKSIEAWTAFIELDKTGHGYHSRANVKYGKSKEYRLAGDKDNFLKYLKSAIDDFKVCFEEYPNYEHRAVVKNQLDLAESEKKNREGVYEAIG